MTESACWYTVDVAAKLLGLHRETILQACRDGRVRGPITCGPHRGDEVVAFKRGRSWRVPVEWLGPAMVRRREVGRAR